MPSLRTPFVFTSLALGLLFAAAVLLPHALQRLDKQYPFQGIEMMAIDAENFYAARVREVADGFWSVGNAYYADLKDTPFVQPPLPEWTIAMMGRLLGLDPVMAFILAKGLFAFLLSLAMIGAFASMTGRRWESLIAVSLLLFANALLNAPWDLPAIVSGNLSPGFLRFARPVNPQWPVTWFFLTLWIFSSWLKDRRTWTMVLAALTTLPMLYAYVYAWTYIAATIGILLLWFLWKRDWVRCRDLLVYGAMVVVAGIPYLWHLIGTARHPWYAASAMRQGLSPKREIVLGAGALLFVPLALFTRKLWPATWPFIVALAFGGLIVLNQQLLTGAYLVPHHYHWYFIQPLASVFFLVTTFALLTQFVPRRILIAAGILICTLAVVFGFGVQWEAYQQHRRAWGEKQQAAGLINFIHSIGYPGLVVTGVADGFVDDYVPVYTSADVYATLYAHLFLVPYSRTRDVFFFRLWLKGITPEEADRRLPTDLRTELSSALYAIYYREFAGDMNAIPDAEIATIARDYRQYWALSTDQKLTLYPLHLVVIQNGDANTPAVGELRDRGEVVYADSVYTVLSITER